MAFLPAQLLARRERLRHQAYPLVHLHVAADDGGLADNGAGAVVHEEMRADLRAWMEIHAGAGMGPLGHDSGDEGDFLEIELMRQPLDGDGFNARISDDHFLFAEGSRVAVVGRLRVGLEQVADARQAGQEFDGQGVRDGTQALSRQFGRRVVFETLGDFVLQAGEHGLEHGGGLGLDFGRME